MLKHFNKIIEKRNREKWPTKRIGISVGAMARSKDVKIVDWRLSTCVPCRRGIFKNQDYTWTNEGFVHTECLEGSNEIKEST